jgi:hypothetical protein
MHWLSLIAPQQPKNEIVKMIDPRTTVMTGMVAGLFSGKTSRMSSILKRGIAPTTIRATPATCKNVFLISKYFHKTNIAAMYKNSFLRYLIIRLELIKFVDMNQAGKFIGRGCG